MVTHQRVLRFHTHYFIWRNRGKVVTNQSIYDFVDSCYAWDDEDLLPENKNRPNSPYSWIRNIRNVLTRDVPKGILNRPRDGEYSWNEQQETPVKWSFITAEAIDNLDGETPNQKLYQEIERLGIRDFTDNWKMTVQGTIERHSRDSEAWGGNYDVFYSVQGMGQGVWGLKSQYRIIDTTNQNSMPNISKKLDFETQNFVNKIIQAPDFALRTIALRRGQRTFRASLLNIYSSCMITGYADFQVLEACHIIPYSVSNDNSVENGLLLRADIHTLFDLKLITLDNLLTIRVSPELKASEYQKLEGLIIKPAPQVDEEIFKINLAERG